ncbi:ClpX C4-type zinc finger protein [Nocardioides stalactiti]|uniref:ClpX C4-type zinc finger protein n=1 Tax=Nocardioides stalactiti TaxID=2755356 RepID=UPI001602C07B|nr:ClpX C4-type zinc finger protein [Nocardioides stalactiti]
MDHQVENKMCSFCGEQGSQQRRLAGGLGAMICFPCLESYYEDTRSPERVAARSRAVWDEMSDLELLGYLPLIVRSAEQNAAFVHDWVALLRDRKVSWAQVGKALGVSRQAAWERFASSAAEKSEMKDGTA